MTDDDRRPKLLEFPGNGPDQSVIRTLARLIELAHDGRLVGIVVGYVDPGGDVHVDTVGDMIEQDVVKLLAGVDILRDELHVQRRELKKGSEE